MNCQECGSQMKPLFVGFFCPNDCDKPKVHEEPIRFLEGARLFFWRGERWRVCRVQTVAEHDRSWLIEKRDQCDFLNWSDDEILEYGQRHYLTDVDSWNENGPGYRANYERRANASCDLWLFTKEK